MAIFTIRAPSTCALLNTILSKIDLLVYLPPAPAVPRSMLFNHV